MLNLLEAVSTRPDEGLRLTGLELWLCFAGPLDGEVSMEKTVLARRLMLHSVNSRDDNVQ